MILKLLFSPLFFLVNKIISFFPEIPNNSKPVSALYNIMGFGIEIMGKSTFTFIFTSIAFWMTAHMTWAVIEWVYKKIPGVD